MCFSRQVERICVIEAKVSSGRDGASELVWSGTEKPLRKWVISYLRSRVAETYEKAMGCRARALRESEIKI